MACTNIDSEWYRFIQNGEDDIDEVESEHENVPITKSDTPFKCEDLYISTQTKIFFLNISILNVEKIFWNTK